MCQDIFERREPHEKYISEIITLQNFIKYQSGKIDDLEREIKNLKEELLLKIRYIQKMI